MAFTWLRGFQNWNMIESRFVLIASQPGVRDESENFSKIFRLLFVER